MVASFFHTLLVSDGASFKLAYFMNAAQCLCCPFLLAPKWEICSSCSICQAHYTWKTNRNSWDICLGCSLYPMFLVYEECGVVDSRCSPYMSLTLTTKSLSKLWGRRLRTHNSHDCLHRNWDWAHIYCHRRWKGPWSPGLIRGGIDTLGFWGEGIHWLHDIITGDLTHEAEDNLAPTWTAPVKCS